MSRLAKLSAGASRRLRHAVGWNDSVAVKVIRELSVCKAVDQVIHAELVRLVGLIERAQAAAGPLPKLRDVGVVINDGHQPLAPIVILEDALEDGIAGDVRLRELIQVIDLKKRVEHGIARHHVETARRAARAASSLQTAPIRRREDRASRAA